MLKNCLLFLIAFFLLCAGSLLSGCGVDNPLQDTAWTLVELSDKTLIPSTEITLAFTLDEFSGMGGCNAYGGDYTVSAQSLAIGEIFSTLQDCSDPAGVLDQEDMYHNLLLKVDSYALRSEELRLFDATGREILVFMKIVERGS